MLQQEKKPSSSSLMNTAAQDDSSPCPICMNDIGAETRTSQCPNGHNFCRSCMRLVYAHRFPRMLTCPMCRTSIDPSILDPKQAAVRAPAGGGMLTLRIGNRLDESTRGARRQGWQLFVDLMELALSDSNAEYIGLEPESLVSVVVFYHRSFRPKHMVVGASHACDPDDGRRRFAINGRSIWEIEVDICVHFRGSGRLAFTHTVSFDGDGSDATQEHRVVIRPEIILSTQQAILAAALAAGSHQHQQPRRPRSSRNRTPGAAAAARHNRPSSAAASRALPPSRPQPPARGRAALALTRPP